MEDRQFEDVFPDWKWWFSSQSCLQETLLSARFPNKPSYPFKGAIDKNIFGQIKLDRISYAPNVHPPEIRV